jgi:hypothetical protein
MTVLTVGFDISKSVVEPLQTMTNGLPGGEG